MAVTCVLYKVFQRTVSRSNSDITTTETIHCLITGAEDCNVKIWRLDNGACIKTLYMSDYRNESEEKTKIDRPLITALNLCMYHTLDEKINKFVDKCTIFVGTNLGTVFYYDLKLVDLFVNASLVKPEGKDEELVLFPRARNERNIARISSIILCDERFERDQKSSGREAGTSSACIHRIRG
jgi:hypothetical protein